MSIDVAIARQEQALRFGQVPAWAMVGLWVYALALINGVVLLNDSDTYWHIGIGRWMLEHHAMPRVDIYSFTRAGEPWISSSWLAQVLYAISFDLAGWAGPIVVASIAIATTFSLLAYLLSHRMPSTWAILVVVAAFLLSIFHALARPHVLAWPVMVAWTAGLLAASERGQAPSYRMLPLIALWANLHGGFVFGLVLAGSFGLDALWNADAGQRKSLVLRWALFGGGALLACCATPYGWESVLASRRILDLGELLHLIGEWAQVDFSSLSPFEICLLTLLAGALFWGVKLPLPRILLLLGLLHMALSHVRNVENFGFLVPLLAAGPLASQFGWQAARPKRFPPVSMALLVLGAGLFTWGYTAHAGYVPTATQSPVAAVDALKAHNAKRVLNDLPFGGYLVARGIPVFVDGRAELYGEQFEMNYFNALSLKDVNLLFDILKRYDIDAVMLKPKTAAVTLLDHLSGWQRVHADENAVVHVRIGNGSTVLVERPFAK
jgi:hypothetical protein